MKNFIAFGSLIFVFSIKCFAFFETISLNASKSFDREKLLTCVLDQEATRTNSPNLAITEKNLRLDLYQQEKQVFSFLINEIKSKKSFPFLNDYQCLASMEPLYNDFKNLSKNSVCEFSQFFATSERSDDEFFLDFNGPKNFKNGLFRISMNKVRSSRSDLVQTFPALLHLVDPEEINDFLIMLQCKLASPAAFDSIELIWQRTRTK